MAQLVEIPEPEPWFLIHGGGSGPDVLMEFDTKDEAESALCTTLVETLIDRDHEPDGVPIRICSVREMFEDPALRDALAVWDAQVVELEVETVRTMEELFLGEDAPILRPGRRTPPGR
ncbi:MAG TPA: hypothetical protein VEC09_04630 [Actinomycetota bacterium]|nr:hypothetical protein [Actinomycetota bacterium]